MSLNEKITTKHRGATAILWDYKSPYYSRGILASAGGYVFGDTGTDYDWKNVAVATGGAVKRLSRIVALIDAGVLPKSVSYSAAGNEGFSRIQAPGGRAVHPRQLVRPSVSSRFSVAFVFFCSETSPDPSVSELVSGMLRASSRPDKVCVPVGDPKSKSLPHHVAQ